MVSIGHHFNNEFSIDIFVIVKSSLETILNLKIYSGLVVSGADDREIKVWRMSGKREWRYVSLSENGNSLSRTKCTAFINIFC